MIYGLSSVPFDSISGLNHRGEHTTDPEHGDGGLVQLDEDTVVDLPQTEQLQDLLHLGRNLKEYKVLTKFWLISSPG